MSTTVNNEATILTSTRNGRTIEIDDMSLLDGGMTDTYVVYENNVMMCDFMSSTPWGRIPGSIEDMAWVALEEWESQDSSKTNPPVHNHGTEEGAGLACNERIVNGFRRGACLPDLESTDSSSEQLL